MFNVCLSACLAFECIPLRPDGVGLNPIAHLSPAVSGSTVRRGPFTRRHPSSYAFPLSFLPIIAGEPVFLLPTPRQSYHGVASRTVAPRVRPMSVSVFVVSPQSSVPVQQSSGMLHNVQYPPPHISWQAAESLVSRNSF
ncbi:hypothetical protein ElyMa_006989800 [Elysia marginata]|uniref:Uncharacterized protein n=1 Tax=Elysia marginata TaxID=1093978 RepID=A0AAV4JQB4_9GAST|nr:hypothetical protein ElyMa_006989800 [Elysia marginata]